MTKNGIGTISKFKLDEELPVEEYIQIFSDINNGKQNVKRNQKIKIKDSNLIPIIYPKSKSRKIEHKYLDSSINKTSAKPVYNQNEEILNIQLVNPKIDCNSMQDPNLFSNPLCKIKENDKQNEGKDSDSKKEQIPLIKKSNYSVNDENCNFNVQNLNLIKKKSISEYCINNQTKLNKNFSENIKKNNDITNAQFFKDELYYSYNQNLPNVNDFSELQISPEESTSIMI